MAICAIVVAISLKTNGNPVPQVAYLQERETIPSQPSPQQGPGGPLDMFNQFFSMFMGPMMGGNGGGGGGAANPLNMLMNFVGQAHQMLMGKRKKSWTWNRIDYN